MWTCIDENDFMVMMFGGEPGQGMQQWFDMADFIADRYDDGKLDQGSLWVRLRISLCSINKMCPWNIPVRTSHIFYISCDKTQENETKLRKSGINVSYPIGLTWSTHFKLNFFITIQKSSNWNVGYPSMPAGRWGDKDTESCSISESLVDHTDSGLDRINATASTNLVK